MPRDTEAAFKDVPKTNMLASLPLIQNTKLCLFTSWMANRLCCQHPCTNFYISFNPHKLDTFHRIHVYFYLILLCKLLLRELLSLQVDTSEAQLMPTAHLQEADENPSTHVSLCMIFTTTESASTEAVLLKGSGVQVLPHRLVFFHTCSFLFHCAID